jgi:predicted RNA binding protein YcfA (HicA-like mRNA interferase family)
MGNSLDKLRRELMRELLNKGWTMVRPGRTNAHLKMRSPGGRMVVMAHSSTSVRGFRNLLSRVRQIEREESK